MDDIKIAKTKKSEYLYFLIAAAIIILLSLLAFNCLLSKADCIYSHYSDVMSYHLNTKSVLSQSLKAGSGIPLWQENIFSGSPAFANPQALYLYPFHLLFYVINAPLSFNLTILLNFIIAGISMYIFACVCRLNFAARLFSALAYMFSFKLIIAAYAGWLSALPILSILPLLFASVFYADEKLNIKGFAFLVVSFALCIMAGHFQFLYYAALILFAYIIYSIIRDFKLKEKLRARKKIILFICAGVFSIGLCGVFLLPFFEYLPLMSREHLDYEYFSGGFANGIKARHLLTIFYPEILGTPLNNSFQEVELWEYVFYFGLIQMILALYAAIRWRKSRLAPFFLLVFAVSILLSFNTPLTKVLFYIIPGYGFFRLPSRFLFIASFSGIALAGAGFDLLIKFFEKSASEKNAFKISIILGALIITFVCAEGFYYANRYIFTKPYAKVVPETPYKIFFNQDRSIYRIAPVGRYAISYGWAASFGLELISGYDPVNLKHYQDYFDIMTGGKEMQSPLKIWRDLTSIARLDLLDALNVKYIAALSPQPLDEEKFELVCRFSDVPIFIFYKGLEKSDFYIYQNKDYLARAFFAENVIEADSNGLAMDLLKKCNVHSDAIIINKGKGLPSDLRASPEDKVQIMDYCAGHLKIMTEALGERFLVISEVWHPGWRARIDGKSARLFRTDLALLGLFVPEGKHSISIDFQPGSIRVGIMVSTCAIFILIIIIISFLRKKVLHRLKF